MAKAILEFDLNDPDDSMAHLRAVKSTDMAMAIWEIVYNTKKRLEYKIENDETHPGPAGPLNSYDVLDLVYKQIWESLDEHGIKIDELIN
jgi:hypothetical protein